MMRSFLLVIFSLGLLGRAHSQVSEIDAKLKQLFFQLDVNASQYEIEAEVKKLHPEFRYVAKLDTFRVNDTFFTIDRDPYPYFKLRNTSWASYGADSITLFLQPALVWQSLPSHPVSYRTKSKQLYGHLISLSFYFSDSLKAESAYNSFKDSLVRMLNLPVQSGYYTSNNPVVGGYMSTFEIDFLKTRRNYQRKLVLSINYHPAAYELKLEFQKLTLERERRRR
jgi:hypothetical protein